MLGGMKPLRIIAIALSALVITLAVKAQNRPQAPASLRLYIFDCGTIAAMNPQLYDLKAEEISDSRGFFTPCYLIAHPRGTLMWDVGQIPDENFPANGGPATQGSFTSTKKLLPQLEAVGYKLSDITYFALSHYHS